MAKKSNKNKDTVKNVEEDTEQKKLASQKMRLARIEEQKRKLMEFLAQAKQLKSKPD